MANARLLALFTLGLLVLAVAPLAHADPSIYNLSFNISSLSIASGGSASVLASAIPQGNTKVVENWQLQKVPDAITDAHATYFVTFNGSSCDGKPCTVDYSRNAIAFLTQNATILKINTTNVTTGSYQLWLKVEGDGNAKVCVMLTGVEKDDCDNYDSHINITVGSLLQAPSLAISPNTVFPGQPISISANEAGGIAPYTYTLDIFDSDDTLAYSNILTLSGSATFTYTPATPGTYSVSIKATDSATTPESSVSKSDSFTVLRPPTASLSAPSNSVIDLGQYVGFGINVNDTNRTETGAFVAWLLADGISVGTANMPVGGGNVILGNTPTYAGSISFNALVRDVGATPAFNFTSGSNTVRVNMAMHNQSIGLSGNTADVGEGINITASVLNGTAPYTYQFYIANAISDQLVANSIPIISSNSEYTYTYNAKRTGVYIANAVIRDGAGTPESVFTGYTTGNVVVHTSPGTSNSLNSSIPGSMDVNQTLNVTLSPTGGIGPFNVILTANGIVVNTTNDVAAGSHIHLLYTPDMTGNVVLAISLTDYGTSTPYTYTLPGTTIHINPPLAPPNLNYSSIVIDKGNAAPLKAISKDGTAPFNYTIKIYSNSSNTPVQTLLKTSQSNVITINFTPTDVGMFKANVKVRDSSLVNEISTSGNVSIRVVPALAVALTPNVTSVLRNQSVTFTGRITGGWPAYNYTVYSVNSITGNRQTQGFGINGTTPGNTITFNAIMRDLGANLFYLSATDNATFRVTRIGEGAVDVVVTANIVNDTVKSTGGVKNNTPSILKVPPKNLTVVVATNSLNFTNVNITVTGANVPANVIAPTIDGNATKPVQIVNITVVPVGNTIVTTNMTLNYSCGLSASSVAPYILKNYTWREITDYTVNAGACSVTFRIPNDPVIAVFAAPQSSSSGGGGGGFSSSTGGPIVGYPQSQPAAQPTTTAVTTAPTTTVATTTVPATTVATTTVPQRQAGTTTVPQQSAGQGTVSSKQAAGGSGTTLPLLGGLAIGGAHMGRLRKRLKRRY